MPNQRFKNAPLDQNQHCQLNGVKKTYATMPPEIRNKILEAALVLQNGVKIRNKVEVKDKGDSDEGGTGSGNTGYMPTSLFRRT